MATNMPELPDIQIYIEALDRFVVGETIEKIRISGISLLGSYDPPIDEANGKKVLGLRRIGKRIVFELEGDLFLVLHLMISGRIRWKAKGVTIPKKVGLAAFDFAEGSILLTEQSTKKRATLHLVRGEEALADHDRGGLEVLEAPPDEFADQLLEARHTVKRALTDQRLFSGIGNAYSDEILHRAKMSPFKLTGQMSRDEALTVQSAVVEVLTEWTDRLRDELGDGFPDKVTAFHDEMAVHGKFKQQCPVCGSPVQRIVYASSNDLNYCPGCQTGGKILADRSLSRILKDDWPKTLEDLE
ncbi:MAG: formamidopyrimidine-DNA glycosylase [Acidimicrobiia bacterium]|nr:formamidopyrimidine-DNA glycosylase [Acidimicrobiia bacterium]